MSDADLKPLGRWTRRPLFSPNQMLTAQQLNGLMAEERERSEMLMRALHGHGIVFGYAVDPPPQSRPPAPDDSGSRAPARGGSSRLEISCGLAIDRHGRPLRWPGGELCYRDLANEQDCPGRFTLSVHHAEQRAVRSGCGPCGEAPEWVEDGVVFTIARECRGADRACPAPDSGQCVSWDEYVCSRTGSGSGKLAPAPDLEWACAAPRGLSRIECSDTYYDPAAGIPIACVEIANLAAPGCDPLWGFTEVCETCEIRPYVYRTPLLYELVRGCQDNLAQVETLSWQDWTASTDEVPWQAFRHKFVTEGELSFRFSRPVAVATVHPGSVFLTSTYRENDSDYVLARRIPARLEAMEEQNGLATLFRLIPHPNWVTNAVKQRSTLHLGGRIELTIRGQMLRDGCGNMLDAVPLFYGPSTPPQHRPGGDFVAVFRFQKAPPPARPARPKNERTPRPTDDGAYN